MAKIHVRVGTKLAPAAVLQVLTDFGEHRAHLWPDIDAAHFRVHDLGPGRAEVTEGRCSLAGRVWVRCRYEWAWPASTVSVATVDSNAWAAGSRREYRLTPREDGGTDVDVQLVRIGKGIRGKLLELVVGLAGAARLRGDMEKVLHHCE